MAIAAPRITATTSCQSSLTGTQVFDLKVDGVGLSESNPKMAEIPGLTDAVNKAKEGITDGSIQVKTE